MVTFVALAEAQWPTSDAPGPRRRLTIVAFCRASHGVAKAGAVHRHPQLANRPAATVQRPQGDENRDLNVTLMA